MAVSPVIVPLVPLKQLLPPPQTAPELVTVRFSVRKLVPPQPPQMAPLLEVIDVGTGVSDKPAALPFPPPQIAVWDQDEPHRIAGSRM